MAEIAIGIVIESLLRTVISVAAEKISLIVGKEKELTNLTEQLKMIKALLIDIHDKQIKTSVVQKWVEKLPSIILDAQIVFEELDYEVLRKKIENRKRDKARDLFSCSNPIAFNPTMTRKMKKVLQEVEDVFVEAGKFGIKPAELGSPSHALQSVRLSTDPYIEHSEFVGRRQDMERVIDMLNNASGERDLSIIAIHGMGGQGKTTLAQHIFNCDKVKSDFDKAIWICVSKDFDVNRLLIEMLPPETNVKEMDNVQALVDELNRVLGGKRLLLVLDDVWEHNIEKWNLLKKYLLQIGGGGGGRGRSKILVTTREYAIASKIGTAYSLGTLSEEESWTMFEKYAFVAGGATKTPHLEAIGRKILETCGGLPLAIREIASLFREKSGSEWSMVDEQSKTWNARLEGQVLHALKFSFDHLPTLSIKKCFAYCAIFEKNTILEKDRLVQLWMAQGLLDAEENLQMEDIGCSYFDTLIRSSLFQIAHKDRDSNITACKMHDLVHDLASKVSKGYCYHVKGSTTITDQIKAAHILIDFSKGVKWKSLKDHMPPNLRTLHIKGKSIELFKDLCKQFPSLCVLIVDDSEATALPESIGDMKHLRVLDISLTSIRSLPKSFTKLYYLQTIRVDSLNEVPKGFGNLKNLRHICMNKPCALPGLGKLKNLRTIPEFKVGKFEGCQIEELEHLDKLRGKLKISNLHNVSSFESVAKSNLSKKCDLQTLELHWNIDCDDDINVMEGLEPHPNVKVLVISGYGSLEFPSWMRSRSDLSSSMRNLVKLQMSSLCKCNKLPSLGHLPCLAYLEIDTLPNLEFIGPEVYGLSNVDWATKKSTGKGSNGSYIITLFPALKVLKLLNMTNLISWFEATDFIPSKPASSSSSVQAKLCPCLEEIVLEGLPNLKAIPNLGSLQKLWVLDVSSCDNLRISWEHRNPQGDEFQQHQFFPWLHRLRICNSDYVSAPICNLIPSLAPVESLQIRCNPSFWPENLYQFINLKELQLGTRWKSDDLEIDDFPWPYPSISNAAAPNHFVSLTVLSLFGGGLPKVRSLPCQIQYLTSLTRLAIEEFTGLETLPEWLGDLECLVELGIVGCRNLKQLPEAFRRLTNLQHLIIGYCPVLGNRCTHGSGSEWPKIAHVPYVDICGNRETA